MKTKDANVSLIRRLYWYGASKIEAMEGTALKIGQGPFRSRKSVLIQDRC